MEHRVKSLNTDYTSNEAYRETLKQDKAKFLHFLERLAIILKIENVSNDLGYELNPDVILTRAEQLMRLEKDSIVDHKSTIANLQRKMQQMKEQLENKDLHLDLLRKKVVSFEESRASKTDLEREIDDHVMLSRKMKVKVDHLSQQVTELRHENTQLKAQITDVQTLKVTETSLVLIRSSVVLFRVVWSSKTKRSDVSWRVSMASKVFEINKP